MWCVRYQWIYLWSCMFELFSNFQQRLCFSIYLAHQVSLGCSFWGLPSSCAIFQCQTQMFKADVKFPRCISPGCRLLPVCRWSRFLDFSRLGHDSALGPDVLHGHNHPLGEKSYCGSNKTTTRREEKRLCWWRTCEKWYMMNLVFSISPSTGLWPLCRRPPQLGVGERRVGICSDTPVATITRYLPV